jgi:hypothetical protein
MKKLKHILLVAIAVLLSAATPVFGGTINSGTIIVGPYDGATFNALSGTGFTVSGAFDTSLQWQVQQPLGQYTGSLGVSGGASQDDFFGGSATIGSKYYPTVNWGSLFNGPPASYFDVIGGPPIQITGPGTYYTTFSMTGSLCGMVSGHLGACDISLSDVSGSGIVTVDIGERSNGFLYLEGATYSFGGTTPEPGSLLLFGSGLLGLGSVLRKRLLL